MHASRSPSDIFSAAFQQEKRTRRAPASGVPPSTEEPDAADALHFQGGPS